MNVKKLIALTTLCAAMLCSGTYITAAAEEGLTIPDSFTVDFSMDLVVDYAVSDRQYAFTYGNNIYIYSINSAESSDYNYKSGELTIYEHTANVLSLEYYEGDLYFSDGSTYLYSDGSATEAQFKFTEYSDSDKLIDGDYIYYLNSGSLAIADTTNNMITSFKPANYSLLKEIDGCFYVVKSTTLCNISNGTVTEISFSYEDYENVGTISTAGISQALGEDKQVQTATVAAGSCLIRVDEDYLGEDNFTVLNVTFAETLLNAQVLYKSESGNAALIAIGSKTYLTLNTNLTVSTYSASAVAAQSYYLLDNASVYAIPFENEYTKTADVSKDTVVSVTGYVSGDTFDYNYYKVEYTADGKTVSGYMIADMLTVYTFDNDNYVTAEISGGDQSYDNNIFTIVLVMIIVLLVLIALGYLVFVATSNSKRWPRKK